MPNNENRLQIKEHYIYDLAIKHRIPVREEVFNEFFRPIGNTFRKAHRHSCCSCYGSKWWLCVGGCAVYKYRTTGDNISLE